MKSCQIFQNLLENSGEERKEVLEVHKDWNNLKRPFRFVNSFREKEFNVLTRLQNKTIVPSALCFMRSTHYFFAHNLMKWHRSCLLYTSDAADE